MEGVNQVTDDAIGQCQRTLGINGRLFTAIPGFSPREQQVQLATAIVKAIHQETILVAEAGTGTGKTFAYLVPALLSGKKVIISTATKTLQDQLFAKDIPSLINALGLAVRVQNLKGRANYICQYRVELHAEQGRFINQQVAHDVLHVREKLSQLTYGERGELPEISEDCAVWPLVTSTSDNCLGNECAFHSTCFLVKARKRATEAQIVVINHHLYFSDALLKQEGFAELLPGAEIVVFDEAHQLAEIATHFHGKRVGTRQIIDLLDDTLREWPALDLANQPFKRYKVYFEQLIDKLLLSLKPHEDRIALSKLWANKAFLAAWNELLALCEEWGTCFASIDLTDNKGVSRCKERLNELVTHLQRFSDKTTQKQQQMICWIEQFKHHVVFHATPLDVAVEFQQALTKQRCAYIFTSATLALADSFDCFTKPLGLVNAEKLILQSPFDYMRQALLYLPRSMPDPKDPRYNVCLLQRALPVIKAFGGRCFFLFTSHRALKQTALLLENKINYPILIQGEEAKSILLARFRQLGNAVLLGTGTFWEGVDVKGEALSCVIIDKLPFASPADPVTHGRMAYMKSCGLSGFDEVSLPHAVLSLKQGAGRLIRDFADSGVLMIADPRLTARVYGQRILASLPLMRKTRDEKTVISFINELALSHEAISD